MARRKAPELTFQQHIADSFIRKQRGAPAPPALYRPQIGICYTFGMKPRRAGKPRSLRIKTRAQEAKAIAQREANRQAKATGLPMPYPNPWDEWDPTKVDPAEATAEKIYKSYLEFCKLCPKDQRKRHAL